MSKPNFWIGVVIGCAVLVASCSKTESPAVSTSDTPSANAAGESPTLGMSDTTGADTSNRKASVASEDYTIKGVLPDVDLVFVRDYTTAGPTGGVLRSNTPTHVLRLHMDVELKNADPAVLEQALKDNQPQRFLTELKKESASTIKGHRGMRTLKMALGCRDASDTPDSC